MTKLLSLLALSQVPLLQGCLAGCGDDDSVETVSRSPEEALRAAVVLTGEQRFCQDVCTSLFIDDPFAGLSVESCEVLVDTAELECVMRRTDDLGRELEPEIERAMAEEIGPGPMPELAWSQHAQRLSEDASPMQSGALSRRCEDIEFGETILEQTYVCTYTESCDAGRRPRRLVGAKPASDPFASARGAWWAAMASLERAAVEAFAELARELKRWGAPEELIARADAAREDEVRHAQLCWDAAGKHGVTGNVPALVETGATGGSDSFVEFARTNATEGCIRETFAALEAQVQTQRSSCPDTAAVLREIAADETRHAQLSWDVDAWLQPLLTRAQRTSVNRSRRRTLSRVWRSLAEGRRGHSSDPVLGLAQPQDRLRLFVSFAHGAMRLADA